jgi:hypothetical protein
MSTAVFKVHLEPERNFFMKRDGARRLRSKNENPPAASPSATLRGSGKRLFLFLRHMNDSFVFLRRGFDCRQREKQLVKQ